MRKCFIASFIVVTSLLGYSQHPAQFISNNPPCQVADIKGDLSDWADLSRYKVENDALSLAAKPAKRVVFFGSSTTDNWGRKYNSTFFPGLPYVNRGISGQTTPQMLIRFQQDVVALQPSAVVFLGGTNDVAGNTGPMTLEMTEGNIRSMVAIAKSNGIKMILASQLPVKEFFWNKTCHAQQKLLALSAWERKFAAEQHLGYVDYYSVLAGPDGNYRPALSPDGVHPDKQAYDIMAPVVEDVIQHVLSTP